ncbi:MAG: PaaI family thioesterase [bacterium]|nr:PaaI family thioesterase [bacterium]
MNTDVASANAILAEVRDVSHSHCRLCGSSSEHGLKLKFFAVENGDVVAEFGCASDFQGYPGIVHGGVLAAMIDSAMSNCLFVERINAVTAEFTIRYHRPVYVHRPAIVRARLDKSSSRLHLLSGEIWQDDRIVASAKSKFMTLPDVAVEEV